jgi:hypothetical protein
MQGRGECDRLVGQVHPADGRLAAGEVGKVATVLLGAEIGDGERAVLHEQATLRWVGQILLPMAGEVHPAVTA